MSVSTESQEDLTEEVQRLRARIADLEAAGTSTSRGMANMQAVTDWLLTDATVRLIMGQMPAVVWATDTACRFTLSQGAGLANLALQPGEVVGRTLSEFLGITDPTHPAISGHRLCLLGVSSSWETEVRGRTFEAHADPLRDTAGEIIGVIGVAWDITERKAAAAALRESETRYRTLAETSGVGIWQIDTHGYTIYANPAICAMLEIEHADELRGIKYHQFFTPESLQRMAREHQARMVGAVSRYEADIVGKNGTNRSVLICGAPLLDDSGRPTALIGTFTDITQSKKAERALRESTERFLTVAKVAPVGILLTDAQGNCSFANERWCQYCGVPPEEALGVNWSVGLHPEDRVMVESLWKRSLLEGRPFRCEVRLIARGVTRWMICEAAGSYDEAGNAKYYVGAVTDITERRAAEEALRHTERLAATGRMAARVAHEINNPLAGIKNSFLLIKDAIPPAHQYYSYVGRIEKEVDRIARIVAQMLDMYRPHQETPREFKIAEAVTDVIAFLETSAKERQLQIVPRLPPLQRSVILPESWLRQVLYNVLQNAIEVSPVGAAVHVEAEAEPHLSIRISDEGPGITPAAASRIFEPFFTTKQGSGNRAGLGLGLSTSRSLVESMGGTITFENQRGGGAMFQILIPMNGAGAR